MRHCRAARLTVLALGLGLFTPADTEAELADAHEVGPLLDEGVLALAARPGSRVHHTANGVRAVVLAVRVHLSAGVAGRETDVGEVTGARDLQVVLGHDEVDAGQGAVGDQAGAVRGLGAVRNG